MFRRTILLSLCIFAVFGYATTASAALRYASPTGAPSATCASSAPCDLATAINSTPNNSDEILVLPGDYGSPASPLMTNIFTINMNVKIHGVVGLTRPRIYFGSTGGLSAYNYGTVSNLEIHSASTFFGLNLNSGGNADHVLVKASGADACYAQSAGMLTDSACIASAPGAAGVAIKGSAFGEIRGVTALSTGAGGYGLNASAINSGDTLDATVSNSILDGATDVFAASQTTPGTHAHVTIDHSNYATAIAATSTSTVTPAGSATNQTAAPALVDAANGDVHAFSNSPTVDAGLTSPTPGLTDLDYAPRTQGSATDIGAYETVVPVTQPPPAPATLTKLALSRTKFRASGSGPTFKNQASAIAKRAPLGSTLSYQLDQPAIVTFTVLRRSPGRLANGSCRAQTPGNRSKKRCTRSVAVKHSGFTVQSVAGKTSVLYRATVGTGKKRKGKLLSKALSPGKYELAAVPAAFGGALGARVVSKPFTVVR